MILCICQSASPIYGVVACPVISVLLWFQDLLIFNLLFFTCVDELVTSKILTCQTETRSENYLLHLHLVPYLSQSWVPWVFPDTLTPAMGSGLFAPTYADCLPLLATYI